MLRSSSHRKNIDPFIFNCLLLPQTTETTHFFYLLFGKQVVGQKVDAGLSMSFLSYSPLSRCLRRSFLVYCDFSLLMYAYNLCIEVIRFLHNPPFLKHSGHGFVWVCMSLCVWVYVEFGLRFSLLLSSTMKIIHANYIRFVIIYFQVYFH